MNLGALVASLGVDSSGLWEAEKDMEQFASNVQKDMAKVQAKLNKVGQQFQDFGKKASMYVTLPILAAGGYAFKMASDMEESVNKVDVAFKSSSKNIKDWSKSTLTSFGLAQGTALDMTALFGDMATGMGLATNNAADMSKSLVGLAGDLSSFKNIGIDQVQTALSGIFTGETESLKRLGIVMTETNLQEYALAQGIMKKVDAMNQAEKVQLRYNYILSVTKNAQGDFMRTQGGAANQMRIFSESVKEISASFGKLLLPTVTSMIKWVNGLMKTIGELDETTKRWIVGVSLAVAAIGPLAFIIGTVMKAFALLTTVVTGTAMAVKFLTAAIASNPWGFLITALAAAGAGVYYYYNSVNSATSAQANLNKELFKTQKLYDNMAGFKASAATLSDMDKQGLEAFQLEVSNSMTQIKKLQSTSYDDFLKQDSDYLKAKERMLNESDGVQKAIYERQLLKIQSNLEQELLITKLTAGQQLKALTDYYNQAEALKKKFNAVAVNTKIVEANAQAAKSFTMFNTDIMLFGKTVDDNQKKLSIYQTQLEALKEAGVTGGEGISNLAQRILGLQSAINMEALPKITNAKVQVTKNITTKVNENGVQKEMWNPKPLEDYTKKLANMDYIAVNAMNAQNQLTDPSKWEIFGSTIQSVANDFKSLGDAIAQASEDGSLSFAEGANIIMQTALSTIGVLSALAAANMITAESAKGLIGIATAVAGLALLAGLFATFATPKKSKAQGMAEGGIVPRGYPNDSYPAMLTSGERVTPPDKLGNEYGGMEVKVSVVGVTKGTDIHYIVKEVERKIRNSN